MQIYCACFLRIHAHLAHSHIGVPDSGYLFVDKKHVAHNPLISIPIPKPSFCEFLLARGKVNLHRSIGGRMMPVDSFLVRQRMARNGVVHKPRARGDAGRNSPSQA
ncbi:hypothetical protein TWF481_005998 [Arthrobotrys musiformis]|uniref:Uncharacterized protein n=1 Tax=Arthrobotrys musiformis TaxID=47236 RepID=A0AAV9WFC8_9PEZI